jgi:hypothetical protein
MTRTEVEQKIKVIENEIKELEEEKELLHNQMAIDIIEETIYNSKQSIKTLKGYAD